MQIERPIRFDRQKRDVAAAFLQKLAELYIRGMLDGRGEDVALAWLQGQRAVDRGVVALGAATRKNDFLWLRIDQGRDFCARGFDVLGQLMPETIRARGIAP